VTALDEYFDFDEVAFVFGVLADKDAAGIVDALAGTAGIFVVTEPESDRALPAAELAAFVAARVGAERVQFAERIDDALEDARGWAADAPKRAVVVTGSIALVGEAMAIAADRGWGRA
jgi:dihydrofolate synthase/folylpolyglutamate synthase